MIENVLASRYASPELASVWDPANKVKLERRLWVTVMEAQRQLGLDIPEEVVAAYGSVVDRVNLASISERERVLRHDVKARLEEFNALAGHQSAHLGMTSRDVTENVEQLQVRTSLGLVTVRAVAALLSMARVATETAALPVTGRTHNVPAQVTTIGKRVASAGEEMILAVRRIERLMDDFPLRGLKGPVGTQQDQMELLGSAELAAELDRKVAESLGFGTVLNSVGQVYPRSLDLEVVGALVQLASGPTSFATTLRLMAGHDLATEGFAQDQVGSSAMPHKMNARTSERIHGFKVILSGHLAMATGIAGGQWNEGDVSCSVVRRVMLPDAFYAIDGLLQSFLTVLGEAGFFPAVIHKELTDHLPFLATTRLLVEAVKAGMGREAAHEVIRRHAVAAAGARREGEPSDIIATLGEDPEFVLDRRSVGEALSEPLAFAGRAGEQVSTFVEQVEALASRHPAALDYEADPIL